VFDGLVGAEPAVAAAETDSAAEVAEAAVEIGLVAEQQSLAHRALASSEILYIAEGS
jgi:hypothetical protein